MRGKKGISEIIEISYASLGSEMPLGVNNNTINKTRVLIMSKSESEYINSYISFFYVLLMLILLHWLSCLYICSINIPSPALRHHCHHHKPYNRNKQKPKRIDY